MSTDNLLSDNIFIKQWITNNSQHLKGEDAARVLLQDMPFIVNRNRSVHNNKSSLEESKKLELKKEFYRIVKDLEDNIKQNKQRLIQDINNPDQQKKNTIVWIKAGFKEEYMKMADDYKNRYNIRLEKILHTALMVNPKIDKSVA